MSFIEEQLASTISRAEQLQERLETERACAHEKAAAYDSVLLECGRLRLQVARLKHQATVHERQCTDKDNLIGELAEKVRQLEDQP